MRVSWKSTGSFSCYNNGNDPRIYNGKNIFQFSDHNFVKSFGLTPNMVAAAAHLKRSNGISSETARKTGTKFHLKRRVMGTFVRDLWAFIRANTWINVEFCSSHRYSEKDFFISFIGMRTLFWCIQHWRWRCCCGSVDAHSNKTSGINMFENKEERQKCRAC